MTQTVKPQAKETLAKVKEVLENAVSSSTKRLENIGWKGAGIAATVLALGYASYRYVRGKGQEEAPQAAAQVDDTWMDNSV